MTISVSILVSGFVSLTLTPMLASRFLKPSSKEGHGRFYNATERFYNGAVRHYLSTLDWMMERRVAALTCLPTVRTSRPRSTGWMMPIVA